MNTPFITLTRARNKQPVPVNLLTISYVIPATEGAFVMFGDHGLQVTESADDIVALSAAALSGEARAAQPPVSAEGDQVADEKPKAAAKSAKPKADGA